MSVSFRTAKGKVIGYSVVLLLAARDGAQTVRVYDAAHGFNEMHRYTRGEGKQDGVVFHRGTLGEGIQAALEAVKTGYREMIEGWMTR